ncbi:MAG: DUF1499 domain-containing protein [Sphingomonas sp.]|nr:DUF1499 domain-containing protein [Sphingomonas sp.]
MSIGGVAAALVAASGSGSGAWPFATGFMILRYAFFAAAAGGVLALIALIAGRRLTGASAVLSLVVLALSLSFSGYIVNMVVAAKSVPAIHDIATNVDDLPAFATLTVRPDNLDNIPGMDRADLAALTPEQRWKAVHRETYGDIKTIKVGADVSTTLRRAEVLAKLRGWDIAASDPLRGTLEATATSRFFRFKDDVAVRVRPDPAGPDGSLVDMRSLSRVGTSDLGVNAARVRSFLADLRKKQGE